MIGFIVSVVKFFFWWFVIGVLGAAVDWWGFTTYFTVTLGWIGASIKFVFDMFVYIGQQWRDIQ